MNALLAVFFFVALSMTGDTWPAQELAPLLTPRLNKYIPVEPTDKQIAALLIGEMHGRDEPVELLYGGAGGGGKSFLAMMAALQYVDMPEYSALLIRKNYPELTQRGGLIDVGLSWLRPHRREVRWSDKDKKFTFPAGATIQYGYLENKNDVYRYAGGYYQFVDWDELTEFPDDSGYTFLFSRVRRQADSQIPVRVFAQTNPVGPGFGWVEEAWDPEHKRGGPRAQHANRYYLPALLSDNPHLDRRQYEHSLHHLDPITRDAILHGRWVARSPHTLFPREQAPVLHARPAAPIRRVRAWDLAASTAVTAATTAGVLFGRYDSKENPYAVEHVIRGRWKPSHRDEVIMAAAHLDGPEVSIVLEVEGGSGGKAQVESLQLRLPGYHVVGVPAAGQGSQNPEAKKIHAKVRRAGPVSSQWGVGAVALVRDTWAALNQKLRDRFPEPDPGENRPSVRLVTLRDFCDRVEAFSHEVNIDEVDAMAMAFNYLEPGGGALPDVGAVDRPAPKSDDYEADDEHAPISKPWDLLDGNPPR